ncbi:MAG: carboxypeptidase regulatory-like domain-containing protein [Phycisphaerae bacterium]|nr:carboxypeptidase regulatory-like domain-containing protein [Phycisphaerae bacterium]
MSRWRTAFLSALLFCSVLATAPGQLATPENGDKTDADVDKSPAVVVVSGQVTDDLGQGQLDVAVQLFPTQDSESGKEPVLEGTTDEMGDFTLRAAEPLEGAFVLVLTKAGYAPYREELHLEKGKPSPFVGVTLEGAHEISGVVRSAAPEEPVAGASVVVQAFFREWRGRTDEQGRFHIERLPPGRAQVVVEAEGYAKEQRTIQVGAEPEAPLEFVLKPERIVEFDIKGDTGEAIAAATVEILDREHDDFRTLATDSTGHVSFRGLSFDAKQLLVRLSHTEYVAGEGFSLTVELPPEKTRSKHELTMSRAGRVAGIVLDDEGRPRNGARVTAGGGSASEGPRAWTNYEGRYEVSGVAAGSTPITVYLSGFAPELKVADIKPGETASVDFRLRPGGTVEGVVEKEDGTPLPGVTVAAVRWRAHDTLGLRALTDPSGRFVLFDTPLDEFEIAIQGLDPAIVPPVRVSGGATEPVRLVVPEKAFEASMRPGSRWKPGDAPPEITVKTLDGDEIKLVDLRGNTVLLDFWATWCGPCLMEVPSLKKLHEKYKARSDFVMIGISLDHDEQALRRYIKEAKIDWPQVFGENGGAAGAADKFGANALPSTFLIDVDGRIAAVNVFGEDIDESLQKLLGEGKRD